MNSRIKDSDRRKNIAMLKMLPLMKIVNMFEIVKKNKMV